MEGYMTILSSIWERIQRSLFPFLEEELGPLTEKQQKLVSILEIIRIEDSISYTYKTGRPPADRKAIARAFVAKAVYNSSTTRELLDRLKSDKALRRICGWETWNQIPNESTFSRAFAAFAESRLPEEVHEALVKKHMSEHLVGHISRDSTEIVAREKPVAREKTQKKQSNRKRGRPKKGETVSPKEETRIEKQKAMTLEEMLADLPTVCDRGTKINSKGYKESWTGYKLHLDTADGQIPITLLLTSASLHDSQPAIPLAIMTSKRITNLYDLMDSAYDCDVIKEFSQKLEHVPIIDLNCRRGEKRELDPAEKTRYNERTTVERVFGRLKDEFGGRMVRVRGSTKVMAHLMFGILALTADQLLKFVQ
jgi:transposase